MTLEDLTLDIEQHIEIKAPPKKVFRGASAPLRQRQYCAWRRTNAHGVGTPGGRWYRDRGGGIEHLWGFVQVIKPPVLLELSGPLFMSYPANNHVEVKLEGVSGGAKVTLRHRAIGMIDPEHRKGVGAGWGHYLSELKKDCE